MTIFEVLQLLALTAVPIVAGGLGLLTYRIRSIQEAIDRNDKRLDVHGERLASVEAQVGAIDHLRTDVKDVHGRVDEVLAEVHEVKGEMQGISNTVRLIERHLLGGAS